jgi:hypothetical protein
VSPVLEPVSINIPIRPSKVDKDQDEDFFDHLTIIYSLIESPSAHLNLLDGSLEVSPRPRVRPWLWRLVRASK